MTGYVLVPAGWQKKPDSAAARVARALSWSRALPAKGTGKAKTSVMARKAKPATTNKSSKRA